MGVQDAHAHGACRVVASLCRAIFAATLIAAPFAAQAQTYPTKPVRVLVGYAPGGIADTSARIITQQLTQRIKQNFIVDSRLGAGGRIAAEAVSRAAPDGYTLLSTTNGTHSFAAVTEKNLPYDPVKDFTPIGLIGTYGFLLVVHPSLPVKSVKELIALAKKNPGKLNYSSSGTGSGIHFAGELFKLAAKVDIVHIPYKGAAPALQDAVAGRVEMTFDAGAGQAVEAGQVRLLGTTAGKRDPRFPNSPTLAEAGLPGFDVISWTAVYGPANLPPAIVSQLNAAMNAALKDADTVQRLKIWGAIASPGGPEQLDALLKSEIARYRKVAADAKLTFE
jgi:tripartite-type tricarboxylate transporter receptor subunit TctC